MQSDKLPKDSVLLQNEIVKHIFKRRHYVGYFLRKDSNSKKERGQRLHQYRLDVSIKTDSSNNFLCYDTFREGSLDYVS